MKTRYKICYCQLGSKHPLSRLRSHNNKQITRFCERPSLLKFKYKSRGKTEIYRCHINCVPITEFLLSQDKGVTI
jgi:hypothetical protein